jgi:Domain of unknown function (DUF4314)
MKGGGAFTNGGDGIAPPPAPQQTTERNDVRDTELEGKRVMLIHCNDEYTKLSPGDLGTVSLVDDMGTVHVKWDDGSTLGLVPGEDRWAVVER